MLKKHLSYVGVLILGFFAGLVITGKWADWLSQPTEQTFTDTSAHFANVDQQIVIYTTKWCPYCKQAREYLQNKRTAYLE